MNLPSYSRNNYTKVPLECLGFIPKAKRHPFVLISTHMGFKTCLMPVFDRDWDLPVPTICLEGR